MNKKLFFLGCLATFLTALPAISQPVERSFPVNSGELLTLDLKTGGDIEVTGWDGQEVSVVARPYGRDGDEIEIEIEKTRSGVEVTTEYRNRRHSHEGGANVEVRVPARFDVELNTMGGSVEIRGVEGTFEGTTMGGSLELANLKGDARLKTMGGRISVRSSDLEGTVETMGGEIEIENVSGGLEGKTMGGPVRYAKSSSPGTSGRGNEVRISTMGGPISVAEAPYGADVSTMGGSIQIRSAKDHVKANTMGGEIEIHEIDGWVEAKTMGGDVTVTMTGDGSTGDRHVNLSSMGGDIELTVPANLSMELDLEIAYTRGNEGEYDIISDFDFTREETTEWDGRGRSARRYITGTGTIGGGKNRIKIRTVNGDIHLKRGN